MPQRCAKTFQIEMVLLESFQAVSLRITLHRKVIRTRAHHFSLLPWPMLIDIPAVSKGDEYNGR